MSRLQRRSEFYLLLATIVLSSVTAFLLLGKPLSPQHAKSKTTLELKVVDQNNRMRVDWNASDPLVQSAQGATLEVEDGGIFNRYPVEPAILRSGGLDYVRRSDDVLLTLTLYHEGKPGAQTSVRRISPVDVQVATTPPPQPRRTSRARLR